MDKPSFEESLRVVAARRRRGKNHPAPDELVAYRAGDLTVEEDDRIQEHLTHCHDYCALLLLDLVEFEQLTTPLEDLGTVDTRAEASWQRLRSRLRTGGEDEVKTPVLQDRPRPRMPLWQQPAIPWTLAAGLALCIMGLGLRMAMLQQRMGDLSAPQIDIALVNLYPESELNTRSEAPQADRVGGGSVLLLHLPAAFPDFTAYEVELLSSSGKEPVFEPQRGQEQEGILTLQLPPLSLPPDSYTVHLYGLTGDQRELLDRYLFEVSPVASQ